MPRKAYGGVNNTSKNGIKIYGGVNNLSKKIIAGYVGVDNLSKRFWPAGDTPIYRKSIIFKNGQFISVPDDFNFNVYEEVIATGYESGPYKYGIEFDSVENAKNVYWTHNSELFDISPNIRWEVKDNLKIDSNYGVDLVDPYILNEILIKCVIDQRLILANYIYCKVIFNGNIKLSFYGIERDAYYYPYKYRLSRNDLMELNSERGVVSEVEFRLDADYFGTYGFNVGYIGINAQMNNYFSESEPGWISENIGYGYFGVNKVYVQYSTSTYHSGPEYRDYDVRMEMQVSTVWSFAFKINERSPVSSENRSHDFSLLISKGPFSVKITEYRYDEQENKYVYDVETDDSIQLIYNSEIFYVYQHHPYESYSKDWYHNSTIYPRPTAWTINNNKPGFPNDDAIARFSYEFLNQIEEILWSQQIVDLEIIDKNHYD